MSSLPDYSWPGNIRELMHATERAVLMCNSNELHIDDFAIRKPGFQNDILSTEAIQGTYKIDEVEKITIQRAINKCRGNMTKVAIELGWGRSTLYRKMKKYDL